MRWTFLCPALVAAVLLASPAGAETSTNAYRAYCQSCHQPEGAGLAGRYPRLQGRIRVMAATPEGRRYLMNVLLNGGAGGITVDGQPIRASMPPQAWLSDAKLAEVLNYISELGPGPKVAPFKAADIAAARRRRPTQVQLTRQRTKLVSRQPLLR